MSFPSFPLTVSVAISLSISLATRSVAADQMSTTLLYRSPGVISPSACSLMTLSRSSEARSRIAFLLDGITMSLMQMEMPDIVAYWKPVFLSWSARMTVAFCPQFRYVMSISSARSFFFINLFT